MQKTIAAVLLLCVHASSARGGDADRVTLKTPRSTVVLDRARHGAVVSLSDNATGLEFVDGRAAQDLFVIVWTRPGDTLGKLERLSGHDAEQVEWDVRDRGLTAVFKRLGGHDMTVVCTASTSPDRDDLRWQLRVTGDAPIVLEQINFPILELRVPLTDGGMPDAVVVGQTKGGVYHAPAQWAVGRGLSLSQPGSLAAQFGCYYAHQAGLLSHTRDARGFPKVLDCRRTKDGLRWMWQRRCYHPLNRPFELGYDISTTTFTPRTPGEPTDWRDAADIYKRWALLQRWCAVPYARRPDVPGWMKAGPGMIRFNRQWLESPERVEAWLDDYWQKHFPGIPLIVALWGWERVGSWVSPKYFPPYPSETDFLAPVAAAKRVGGHAFPWPSGYYWNVEYQKNAHETFTWNDWEDFNTTGLPHALRQRDGTPLVRRLPWLHGGRNAVLCRGDVWTRQWFNRTAVTLMQLGCDMVQVDQVVGGQAPGEGACFSTEHGHPQGPGVWDAEAFTAQLQSLAAQCRRVQPSAVLAIEEPQELYNHLIGVQDYRDAQDMRWPELPGLTHASIFGYLYHEFLPVFQSNPQPGDRRALAYCAVTGQIPHWVPHSAVTPGPALVNGDFEQWIDDVPAGWQRVTGWQGTEFLGRSFRDDTVKVRGTASMRLENSLDTDIVQVSQNVPVGSGHLKTGHTYRLRARAKVEQLAKLNAINVAALTPGLAAKGVWHIPLPEPGDWAEGSAEFTMPPEATFLRIMVHVGGPCRVWVDDLALDERVDGTWQPLVHQGLPPEHDFIQQWVELFHGAGRPYLMLGKMIRPPTLTAPAPPVEQRPRFAPIMLNAFRALDGSEAAIIVNATGEEQNVRFEWQQQARTLQLPPWTMRLVR